MRKRAELLSACHHAVMSSCRHVIIPSCCHINHWQLWYIWQLWTTLDYLWQLPAALANLTTSANLPSILGVSWQPFGNVWHFSGDYHGTMSYAYDVILSYFHYVILSSCHLPWCGLVIFWSCQRPALMLLNLGACRLFSLRISELASLYKVYNPQEWESF